MDKTDITAIKKFLEENVKNKTYIEHILNSAEDVYYNYEDSELLKKNSEETKRSRIFMTFINKYNPSLNFQLSTMSRIIHYFEIYSEDSADEIISELKLLDLKSYNNLRNLPEEYIQNIIYVRDIPDKTNLAAVGQKIYREGSHLFYSVYHALVQTLGIEASLKFLEEFTRLNVLNGFSEDSRHPLEIFMDALFYCSDNYEYPVEWNLSQAFLDSKLNRIEKVKNG